MKYPLTEDAKLLAHALVEAWNNGKIEQACFFRLNQKIESYYHVIVVNTKEFKVYSLRELSRFGLIVIEKQDSMIYNLLLLQELRNAVENDFEVSDYFLTMNAVGNIIVNSTTGPVQGVGYNTGIVHQNVEQLADYMTATLGEEFLANQADLATAIRELRTSLDSNRQSKLGKVVSELGNCLQHGANAYSVTSALVAIAPFIQRMLGG